MLPSLCKKRNFAVSISGIFIFLHLSMVSVLASSLTWLPKRSIGKTIIWKHSSIKNLRASSRFKNAESVLPTVSNREKLIKDFEDTKKKALGLTGVKNWQASSYKWQGNERLLVKGTYNDRKGQKITFNEVHLFRPKHRLIVVVTHERGEEISAKTVEDLVETIIKAESVP